MASGLGSADALRAVAGGLVADAVAVLSADLVSDVPLGAVLAAHTVSLSFLLDGCAMLPAPGGICAGVLGLRRLLRRGCR